MPTHIKADEMTLSIAIPREVHKLAKIRAAEEGITLKELYRCAIADYCAKPPNR